jgi:hypothetical protein
MSYQNHKGIGRNLFFGDLLREASYLTLFTAAAFLLHGGLLFSSANAGGRRIQLLSKY